MLRMNNLSSLVGLLLFWLQEQTARRPLHLKLSFKRIGRFKHTGLMSIADWSIRWNQTNGERRSSVRAVEREYLNYGSLIMQQCLYLT